MNGKQIWMVPAKGCRRLPILSPWRIPGSATLGQVEEQDLLIRLEYRPPRCHQSLMTGDPIGKMEDFTYYIWVFPKIVVPPNHPS